MYLQLLNPLKGSDPGGKAGKTGGWRGIVRDGLFIFLFLARKLRYWKFKGRKVQNQARKRGQKNKKTKNESPKVERLVMQSAKGSDVCPPARPPARPSTISARGEGKAMLAPATEWVLAGQQTQSVNITGKTPVDTRLFIEFLLFVNTF